MLDFGWAELLVIGLILLLVIGPQDIPKIMYQAGRFFRRLHYMKFALSQQFDDFMEKAEQKIETEKQAVENAGLTEEAAPATPPSEKAEDPEEELLMDESNPYFIKNDEESELDGEDVAVIEPKEEEKKPEKSQEGQS
jgi:sec-independent protein translocase protein TatB